MMICEKLFLLLMKDTGSPENWGGTEIYGLRGAVLADLIELGRLEVDDGPRIRVIDASPTGHPALDQALQVLPAQHGAKISPLTTWCKITPHDGVVASLCQQGVIEVSSGGLLGLRTTYPTVDPAPERALRQRLYAVLRGEQEAADQDRILLCIVHALGIDPKIFPQETTGLGKKDLKHRIRQLAGTDVAGQAVDRTIQAIRAAIAMTPLSGA